MVDEPLDLVTLLVKGYTVSVVLSLMHVCPWAASDPWS